MPRKNNSIVKEALFVFIHNGSKIMKKVTAALVCTSFQTKVYLQVKFILWSISSEDITFSLLRYDTRCYFNVRSREVCSICWIYIKLVSKWNMLNNDSVTAKNNKWFQDWTGTRTGKEAGFSWTDVCWTSRLQRDSGATIMQVSYMLALSHRALKRQ